MALKEFRFFISVRVPSSVLPAGRSGSVELLLDLPADAQDLTVTWYRGEVSQELEILLP